MGKIKTVKPDNFLYDGLSIDETKTSVIIITYVISFAAILILGVIKTDMDNLMSVFYSTIAAVTGINITNAITNRKSGSYEESNYTQDDDSTITNSSDIVTPIIFGSSNESENDDLSCPSEETECTTSNSDSNDNAVG